MKSLTVLLVAAGLVSAMNVAHPIPHKRTTLNLRQANVSAEAEAEAAAAVISPEEAESLEGVVQDGSVDNADSLNLDGLNLDGLNLGDFNNADNFDSNGFNLGDLGNLDLNNLDLINQIDALVNGMGLGGFIDASIFSGFGGNEQLELFLLLQQLGQLQGLGFINQFDILALLQQGLILNNFNFGKPLVSGGEGPRKQ
jgi:hypothetical protein